MSRAHLRHLNPFPKNLGVLARFERVLIPEMNLGQLAFLIRGHYLKDVVSYPKVQESPSSAPRSSAKSKLHGASKPHVH